MKRNLIITMKAELQENDNLDIEGKIEIHGEFTTDELDSYITTILINLKNQYTQATQEQQSLN